MNESFWYLADDEPAHNVPVTPVRPFTMHDYAPTQESMRGGRTHLNAPSADQKRVRRTLHRSGELEDKEAAYGEGAQQFVIPTHKLPLIDEEKTRKPDVLHGLLSDLFDGDPGFKPITSPPKGFDEPFQKDRFKQRMDGRDFRQRRKEMPDAEKTPEGRGADRLADMIGEVGTEREPRDATTGMPPEERKHKWFKDRWDSTFEPLGYSDEGNARSRRNTRARWEKTMGPTACDHPNCPPWEHHDNGYKPKYSSRTATVLNTQVERLNKGDQVRTPTGQTMEVKGIRPHETDATKMYLDTDSGTSVVDRGLNFQVVPKNSQQQELPDIGNPMGGNSAQTPGAGHGPGGPAPTPGKSPVANTPCPNCHTTGSLHLRSGNYMCTVCGFTIAAGGTPGGLMFSNQPRGFTPQRRAPGTVPQAHVWASKYSTHDGESQMARRARQVLGGEA
jgi:hypothetical protein